MPSAVVRKIFTTTGKQVIAPHKGEVYHGGVSYGETHLPGSRVCDRLTGYHWNGGFFDDDPLVFSSGHHCNKGPVFHPGDTNDCPVVKLEKDGTGIQGVVWEIFPLRESDPHQRIQCHLEHSTDATTLGGATVQEPHTLVRCEGTFDFSKKAEDHYTYQSTEVIRTDNAIGSYSEKVCDFELKCIEKTGTKVRDGSLPLFDEWYEKCRGQLYQGRINAAQAEINKPHWQNYALAAAGAGSSLYCCHRVYRNLKTWNEPSTVTCLSKISRIAAWAFAGMTSAYLCLNQLKIA